MINSKLKMQMMSLAGFILLGSCAAFAQEASKPEAPKPNEMEHMQHGAHHGFMQGGMNHAAMKNVNLEQKMDPATHTVTLRQGPLSLPASTNHMTMPQPPDVYWTVPVNGWLLSYTPQLVDATGNEVPGRLLHHVAFWNTNRADFLCPNKEEHIFGAGGEMNSWPQVPGFGYRVHKGDKIRIETMVHNPTTTAYDKAYLEVQIGYQEMTGDPLTSYYPAWMDVQACGDSGYDLKPGKNETTGRVKTKYEGVLLGVGGHMHDYAQQIILEDVTGKATVATLYAKLDEQGHLMDIPPKVFFDRGGYPLHAGEELKITATYDNPTGQLLGDGAMGIVVGYFVPAVDAALAGLRREKEATNSAPQTSHDH